MKYLKWLSFALVFGLLISSCKKNSSDDDGIAVGGEGCTASWKVNGTAYSEDDMTICLYIDSTLNLSASVGFGFQLQVDPITNPGTFVVDPTDLSQTTVIIITLNDDTQIGIKSGEIKITELSSSGAKGTFSGAFYDFNDLNQAPNFAVTDGVFEANF